MRHTCNNCHFFAKEHRVESTGTPYTFSFTHKERKAITVGDTDFIKSHYSLKCHMGVWDEGLQNQDDRFSRLTKINRKGGCFFFPHKPDMLFSAAVELQKRSEEFRQIKRSNLYTQIGLGIATLALLVDAFAPLIEKYIKAQ